MKHILQVAKMQDLKKDMLLIKCIKNILLHIEQIISLKQNGLIEINRFVKDEDEIDNCKKACLITDKAFEHIKGFIKPRSNRKRDCF